jgi:hypothetical protein
VRTVLPLSVNDATYADPANRDRIQPALQSLAAHADVLARHGGRKDAGFGYLGRHLATDTRTILSSYESGELEQSQFLLRQLTEYCVTCHSRLPSPNDSPLSTLERLFASTSVHSANLLSPLTDYLVVSIRVKGDLARPLLTLEKFSKRPDLWRNLRLDVAQWIADLKAFREEDLAAANLATAKRILEEAKGMINFPGDRSALVHYVVASSILHRYAEAHAQGRSRDLAEAYYYLGLVESRIGRDYWISQSGMFLETSIRLAPDDPYAEKAYALLEEEIILGYSGSGGIHIPPDLEQNLEELQKLIDAR